MIAMFRSRSLGNIALGRGRVKRRALYGPSPSLPAKTSKLRVARAAAGVLGGAQRLPRSLICLDLHQNRAPASEARRGPVFVSVVVLGDRGHAVGDDDPRLFRRSEDMNVGRQQIGIIERADSDEADDGARAGVVAPNRDPALRAAR